MKVLELAVIQLKAGKYPEASWDPFIKDRIWSKPGMTHERLLFPRRQDGHPFPVLPVSIKSLGAVGNTHWGGRRTPISRVDKGVTMAM